MFRALVLIFILAGNPQYIHNNLNLEADLNLIEIKNFQYIQNTQRQPFITAKSALAFDLDTFLPLYQKNINQKLPIASLAKLMTALVILEENKLEEVVTITPEVTQIEGSRIWLYPHEQMTVGDLLQGMLIASGNDAAFELALYNSKNLQTFTQKTKRIAQRLGLKNSQFIDPTGLDDENNFSTAGDLAILVKYLLKKDLIRQIIQTQKTTIYSTDHKITHNLTNTNQLLHSFLNAQGMKTGTTNAAKECLITLLKIKDNEVIIILLGSENRYQDTKAIYHYLSS